MKCPNEMKLSAFVDGELAAGRAVAIETHVASCSACSEAVARFRETDRAGVLTDVPVPGPAEWQAAWDAIAARVSARPAWQAAPAAGTAFGGLRGLYERLRWVRWAAAAAVLALAIVFWDDLSPKPRTSAPEAVAAPCVVEYLEPGEGYLSVYTQAEDTGLTLITVMPAQP
jgi:anti-sigma factor RsiW